jgi:hypothetical protein
VRAVPTTVEQHRREFCRLLETGRWRQCRYALSWHGRNCILGAALRYCGRSARGIWPMPWATRGKLDMSSSLARELRWLNDSGASFRAIAAFLRTEWRVER